MITPTTPIVEDSIGSRSAAALDSIRGYDRPFARVSWGSIFAGALFALATQVVLTLLGLAVGLATLAPASGTPQPGSLGIGAGIWMLISSLISLFAGGYIAGRLGGTFNGWIHGLITWATFTFLTLMLLTTAAGRLIGAASGLGRFATQGAAQAAQIAPALQQPLSQLQTQAQQEANRAAQQAQQKAQEAQAAAQQPGEQPIERQAREAGQKAAETGAAGSFGAALALILGAVAAAFGGKSGQRYPHHELHGHHERPHTVEEKTTVTPARSTTTTTTHQKPL